MDVDEDSNNDRINDKAKDELEEIEKLDSDRDEKEERKRRKKEKKKSKDRDREREKKHKDKDRDREKDKDRKEKEKVERNDDEKDSNFEREKEKIAKEKDDDRELDTRGKDRDKDKDPDRRRDSRDRDRPRDRSRERDWRRRDRSRDRDGFRDKERYERTRRDRSVDRRDRSSDRRDRSLDRRDRRIRDRSRERVRERSSDKRDRSSDRRDRDRDRSAERLSRRRERERERERERDIRAGRNGNKEKEEEKDDGPKPVTLKDIIAAYPGISLAEAAQRLNAHNSAIAMGAMPPGGPSLPNAANAAVAASAMAQLTSSVGIGGVIGEGGALTKPHRELYVGNLPPGVTVPQLAEFLNTVMKQVGLAKGNMGSVVTAWESSDGHYAFVEFRTIDETLGALTYLNGLQVGAHSLKVGRPKGYNGSSSSVAVPMGAVTSSIGLSFLGGLNGAATSTGVNPLLAAASNPLGIGLLPSLGGPDVSQSNFLMVTNVPIGIEENQASELFSTFGELKAFNLIKSPDGTSQTAALEYVDTTVTETALSGLNKLEIAEYKLSVQRIPEATAKLLLKPANANDDESSKNSPPKMIVEQPPADPLASNPPTTILRLSNMTTKEDLTDDELYLELKEDVSEECNRYGTVVSIVIPRSVDYGGIEADKEAVGQIFVKFTDVEGAKKAHKAVHGRSFNGLTVNAVYYPEDLYEQKRLTNSSTKVLVPISSNYESAAADLEMD